MEKQWFETWFDTEEYHTLYKNRDEEEAKQFIDKLIQYLKPHPGSKFLDIACGKGRHAKQVFDLGFEVVGYDLSKNSIAQAQEFAQDKLSFYQHDMRVLFRTNYFDFALNLFTSFGYFDSERDELKAMKSAVSSLKKGGKLVIDFLNKQQVLNQLITSEYKEINGVQYHIQKSVQNNQVIKSITYYKNNQLLQYHEKVKLLTLEDFKKYLSKLNFTITASFGDYQLNPFDIDKSARLILIAEENS